VRAVVLGLGVGIIGAGAMIPLGPSFAKEVLNGGSAAFGVLMTALGFGAAFGVVTLLWLQNRLPRVAVFTFAVIGVGAFLTMAASFSILAPAALMIGGVGACAGGSYVTGFTVLQETTSDELRGRTFATLYTVIRLCLLISLTISPLWADFWDWITRLILGPSQTVTIGPYSYALPGVRIALWGGGLIALVAGLVAWRSVRRALREPTDDAARVVTAEADETADATPPTWNLPNITVDEATPPDTNGAADRRTTDTGERGH
jgi:dTMP kinase